MPHQPPVPEASTSPYPLQPAPVPEEVKLALAAQEEAEDEADAEVEEIDGGLSARMIGVGAAIGLGAAAAVTGLLYARRRPTAAPRKATAKKKGGDDKRKRGKSDRSRVAANEPYEVSYFARKHKLSASEARAIIKKAGPDRDAANALAKRSKKK